MIRLRRFASVLLAGCIAFAAGATPKRIGSFRDWSAWMLDDPKAKECFAFAVPLESKGAYTRRGRVSVAVTHRPAGNVKNEVSFTAGYTHKPDSEVRVTIDDRSFRLFVDADTSFARDAATDATLVEAMARGRRMVVRGVSSRGTETTDTYSLLGFTAAYRAIGKACGVS